MTAERSPRIKVVNGRLRSTPLSLFILALAGCSVNLGPSSTANGSSIGAATHILPRLAIMTSPRLAPSTKRVLYSFLGGADGANPGEPSLLTDVNSGLYGTTSFSGPTNHGTVFKLTPAGSGLHREHPLQFPGRQRRRKSVCRLDR
jgi:uncharacterized repeat protein (TIGR03803 family)